MPIYKFNKVKNINTFNILEDHFRKLWLTSDLDSFHIQARVADEKRIISEIFEKRHDWLQHVYGAIYNNKCNDEYRIDDYRLFPRRTCEHKVPVDIKISPLNQGNPIDVKSTIENISQEGMCLKIKSDDRPAKGDKVALNLDLSKLYISTRVSMKYLMDSCNNVFEVMWTNDKNDESMSLIGLHATKC